MSSLQLESTAQIVPEPQKLPQILVEKCAAISVRPDAIKSLTDAMQCELSILWFRFMGPSLVRCFEPVKLGCLFWLDELMEQCEQTALLCM